MDMKKLVYDQVLLSHNLNTRYVKHRQTNNKYDNNKTRQTLDIIDLRHNNFTHKKRVLVMSMVCFVLCLYGNGLLYFVFVFLGSVLAPTEYCSN